MKTHTFSVPRTFHLARLDDFLNEELTGLPELRVSGKTMSRSKVRRLIVSGSVEVQRRVERNANLCLRQGWVVRCRVDSDKFFAEKAVPDLEHEFSPADVVFEDSHIIVISKPAGFPSDQSHVESRDHVLKALTRFLSVRDGTTAPYLALHHRLDRGTSGLMLLSKSREANGDLHRQFLEHSIRKVYTACTLKGRTPRGQKFVVENQLSRVSPRHEPARWGAVANGGQRARTEFLLKGSSEEFMIWTARPETGRTHQIRVHLSGAGLPIVGDQLYGGNTDRFVDPYGRFLLHASELTLSHPVTGEKLHLEARLPDHFHAFLRDSGLI